MILLLWKSRVETRENRRRITWFVSSLVLGLSPILVAAMLTPLVPALRNPEWRAPIGIVLYVLLASIVPITAYAVGVSHVMDVHLVIRRTMQYGLARSSVWCAIVAPVLFVAFDLHRHRLMTVEEYLIGFWGFFFLFGGVAPPPRWRCRSSVSSSSHSGISCFSASTAGSAATRPTIANPWHGWNAGSERAGRSETSRLC
jgi:hypothetical protein